MVLSSHVSLVRPDLTSNSKKVPPWIFSLEAVIWKWGEVLPQQEEGARLRICGGSSSYSPGSHLSTANACGIERIWLLGCAFHNFNAVV
ncbi:hypothetical protein ACLOJK_010452 [Asimina triloba]